MNTRPHFRKKQPKFPPRCVGCGMSPSSQIFPYSVNSFGLADWANWLPGKRFRFEVPVCWNCHKVIRRSKTLRMLLGNLGCLQGIVAGAIVLVGIPHVGKWGLAAALGIGSLFMLPYFLYDILSKDLFRVRVLKEELYFDFNNREYCKEFEMMNGAASGR